MAIYRIHVTLASGQRSQHTGLFTDGIEAVMQTRADFPTARRVQVRFIRRQA